MKVLCITRCYPPVIGGMEKVSFELTSRMANLTTTHVIANRRGKKFLPLFLPYALFKAVILIKTQGIDIVHLGDGALAPLGTFIKRFCRIPVVATVHGLDVTYSAKRYQALIPRHLGNLDKLICISRYTMEECVNREISAEKCTVITNGVNPDEFYFPDPESRVKLQDVLKTNLTGKFILLSVGHLVARKGVSWFIQSVMPKLEEDYVYLVIGGYGNASKGDEKTAYNQLAKGYGVRHRVFLLGHVPDEILRLAYNSADLLIMPNVMISGDMEGFGVVALEAASCNLPVIASDLEGIKDAVKDEVTGLLVEPYDVQDFLEKIYAHKRHAAIRAQARDYVLENYAWDRIAARYYELFEEIIGGR
ncbi:MAG: glycosyltransferase family 4 protein [Candidatus Schekmanbacteria bacterium]|nr:glycosyltransferase family 4 protein [Candidatus Schekmanbacteria bacterium]